MPLNAVFKKKLGLINERLRLLTKVKSKSVKYLLNNVNLISGKKIRGLLVLFTAEIKNGKAGSEALNAAAAMEILHHATLIHDDVVDAADTRRGRATINRKIGNEVSILAGDYLFSVVTDIIAKNGNRKLFNIFSGAVREICEGEIEEVFNKNNAALSKKAYMRIIEKKTASLIRASVESGAACAGINSSNVSALRKFALNAGLAFQIKDDILDLTATKKRLGKPSGNDIKEGRITLPFICAMKNAGAAERKKLACLVKSGKAAREPSEVIRFIKRNGGIEDASAEAELYIKKAKRSIGRIKGGRKAKKQALIEVADYVLKRNY